MNRTEIIEAMARAMHADGYTDDLDARADFVKAEYRSQAEAALSALEALEMVVVPRVATEKMALEGHDALMDNFDEPIPSFRHIWTAMLTAAQTKGQDID